METFKLKTYVGSDGILKLEVPVNVKNTDLEVVVIMHSTENPVDELGRPVGFFEETYGSLAGNSDFQKLVAKCKSLPPAKGNYLVHDYVENLFITVLDFQMRVTTVDRALAYYHQHARKEIADFAALKNLFSKYPNTKEGNLQIAQYLWGYNLWTRVEMLRRFVAYFETRGVTTQEQLKQWVSEAIFERDFKGKIKGADFAIFNWLMMRQGIETIKPDTWIHRFIEDVLGYSVSNQRAVELLKQVAQEMGIKAYELDWRIWENQTGRT